MRNLPSIRTITMIPALILVSILLAGCAGHEVTGAGGTNARAIEDMGLSLVEQGNLRAGLEQLLKAVELNPDSPDLHREIANVYRALEKYDLALQHFGKALGLRPRFPEAQNDRGILYSLMGKPDLAIESFRTAADDLSYKTPEFAYNNLGLAYYRKGDYDNAIYSYIKAIKEFPSYATCYANLGLAYEAINRWDEAVKAYSKAIQYDPKNPAPYIRLGNLHYRQNRKSEASDVLNRFLGIVKTGPDADAVQNLLRAMEGQ